MDMSGLKRAQNIDFIRGEEMWCVKKSKKTFDKILRRNYWSFRPTAVTDATHYWLFCYEGDKVVKSYLVAKDVFERTKTFKIYEGSTSKDQFLIN